jgi:hypothetical protein
MSKKLITYEALKMFKYFEVSKTFAKFELLKTRSFEIQEPDKLTFPGTDAGTQFYSQT